MYRCGNNYQDTPCDGGGQMKRIGKATGTARTETEAQPQAVDTQCVSRGQLSLKIIWAREGGATMERQLAEAKTPQDRRLVASVYDKRGSAPSIRSQIEAECQAEQEKLRQAAALAAAAAQLRADLPQDVAAQNTAASQQSVSQTPRASQTASSSDASKSSACARLSASMESLREQQRAGGGTAAMERMSQQKRNLEAVMRSNGC
jgi:hypothetical protein